MMHIKICGLTNLEDATVALEAGADMLGFIFVPNTPRFIAPDQARDIVAALPRNGSRPWVVGVFSDEPTEKVRAIMQQVRLDKAQLQGHEPVQMLRDLGPRAYKVLRPRGQDEAQALVASYQDVIGTHPPAFLLDAFDPGKLGGTGKKADWTVAAELARQHPLLLAGGLTPDNVTQALRLVQPWGVDVASGVERAPGLKDHAKVRRFCERAKGVGT